MYFVHSLNRFSLAPCNCHAIHAHGYFEPNLQADLEIQPRRPIHRANLRRHDHRLSFRGKSSNFEVGLLKRRPRHVYVAFLRSSHTAQRRFLALEAGSGWLERHLAALGDTPAIVISAFSHRDGVPCRVHWVRRMGARGRTHSLNKRSIVQQLSHGGRSSCRPVYQIQPSQA